MEGEGLGGSLEPSGEGGMSKPPSSDGRGLKKAEKSNHPISFDLADLKIPPRDTGRHLLPESFSLLLK